MFCSTCGKQLQTGARFCSFCGSPAVPHPGTAPEYGAGSTSSDGNRASPGPDAGGGTWGAPHRPPSGSAPPPPPRPRLTRPRSDRMIAGVCSGVALHFGWDITLVRILVAVFSLFLGTGVLVYLAAWIIIPEAPLSLPSSL